MTDLPCTKVVMVVDDDLALREALVDVLDDFGYHTIEAGNGQDALRQLRDGTDVPCLILLDMMMPVMDGEAFRHEQQNDPDLMTIPVVVISAHANARATARKLAVSGFLSKPIDLDALVATVDRHCPPPSSGTQAS